MRAIIIANKLVITEETIRDELGGWYFKVGDTHHETKLAHVNRILKDLQDAINFVYDILIEKWLSRTEFLSENYDFAINDMNYLLSEAKSIGFQVYESMGEYFYGNFESVDEWTWGEILGLW